MIRRTITREYTESVKLLLEVTLWFDPTPLDNAPWSWLMVSIWREKKRKKKKTTTIGTEVEVEKGFAVGFMHGQHMVS